MESHLSDSLVDQDKPEIEAALIDSIVNEISVESCVEEAEPSTRESSRTRIDPPHVHVSNQS